ncbi:hypothetical protein FEZ63_07540 [Microvirga brassicacearum]|uniref:Uncharacterized protein n=1 Tax=Microvirga brassicacearum TaxID=2580413 RepID=A0A5N3PDP9_9HYPH|nr:hypothetical protein FEZ63_07540 [Microvirga brassicacearum]
MKLEETQLEIVRLSCPDGRYDSEIATKVATKFGVVAASVPPKRPRGRPRIYGLNDPRPPRPSRAKTPAGRLRAASMRFAAKRSSRRAPSCEISAIPSSARTSVPKIASEIGRSLMESTIAGSRGVDAIEADQIRIEVAVSDHSISVDTHIDRELVELNSVAPETVETAVIDAALAEPTVEVEEPKPKELISFLTCDRDDTEVAIDDFVGYSALQHHYYTTHEFTTISRGEFEHRLDYDFTDAGSIEKAAPEVRALFKGYGLSTHFPTYDQKQPELGMKDEDLLEWLKVTLFAPPRGHSDLENYLREYDTPRALYRMFRSTVEPDIQEERIRVEEVWPAIDDRLWYVELHYNDYKSGRISLDCALVRVAFEDHQNLGNLSDEAQAIWDKVVDAMNWFDGFSRLDMAKWAGRDLSVPHWHRTHEGFPGFMYPERLHHAVLSDAFRETELFLKYTPPTDDELEEVKRTMPDPFRVHD